MKFVLEVDISAMTGPGQASAELGRILRYWAGALKQLDPAPGLSQAVYDSGYREVGHWTITDAPPAVPAE